VLGLLLASLTANAVEKPKSVFIKSYCTGPLGTEILASFRQEIRASAGYQLATSLTDDGGYDVVVTAYITCVESTLPTSERVVSVASIFGTGTCTGGSCSVSSNEPTLQAMLCSGKRGTGCGRDLYVSLDDYMSKDGGYIFRQLSDSRKRALGN
jgi:hypothetical protein